MTYVFVYGTLKLGFYNYLGYIQPAIEAGKAFYIGRGRTKEPDFCLVIEYGLPCLYRPLKNTIDINHLQALQKSDCPVTGYSVPGDVFLVDDDTLQSLDELEGVSVGFYNSEKTQILLEDGAVRTCTIYTKPRTDSLQALQHIPEFTEE